MFNFPFGTLLPNNYNKTNRPINHTKNVDDTNIKKNSITNSSEQISNTIDLYSNFNSSFNSILCPNPSIDLFEEQAIFEIFGIKLYLDEIIIIGILIFLYKQDVKDNMLYVILFLLLFS